MKRLSWPLAVSLLALPAFAGGPTHTWSGAVNGNWSVAGNWVENVAPAPAPGEMFGQYTFPASASNKAMNNDIAGLHIVSLNFQDTGYSLAGAAITAGSITIQVSAGVPAGTTTVALNMTLSGGATLLALQDANLAVTGVIGGPDGINVQSLGGPSGLIHLSGANSYAGQTNVQSGYLYVENATALGTTASGTAVSPGATLNVAAVTVVGEALAVGGSGASGNGAIQMTNATWQGPVTLTANTVVRSTGTGTIDGVVSGGFGITYAVSTFVLAQNNGYTGTNSVDYGTVIVNGSQPLSPWVLGGFSVPNSTLGGSGTVGSVATGIGTTAPKIVDPGPVGGTGILSTGNFSLNDTANGNHAVLHVDLNGTTPGSQYDRVAVTGSVDLTGAALQVSVGYVPVVSDTFTIISNDGGDAATGTFAGLAQGATFVAGGRTFQISYTGGDGNDVTLTVTSLTPVGLAAFTAE